jgi:hypothetical protein
MRLLAMAAVKEKSRRGETEEAAVVRLAEEMLESEAEADAGKKIERRETASDDVVKSARCIGVHGCLVSGVRDVSKRSSDTRLAASSPG